MMRFRKCKRSYQSAIATWINENGHVTAKIVSLVFGKHINMAKEMLFDFVSLVKQGRIDTVKPSDLKVVYLLAGYKNNKRLVTLVSEDKVQEKEAQFTSLTSKHIDSVARKDCTSERHECQTEVVLRYGNCRKYGAITNEKARPSKRDPEQLVQRLEPIPDPGPSRKRVQPPRAAKTKCPICGALQCTSDDGSTCPEDWDFPTAPKKPKKALKQIPGQRSIKDMFF